MYGRLTVYIIRIIILEIKIYNGIVFRDNPIFYVDKVIVDDIINDK